MTFSKYFCRLSVGICLLTLFLFAAGTAFAQAEKLGIVNYTPPKGMTKTLKENVVLFSEFNQTTGMYCIITVYGATPGTGNAKSDFEREWNNLVVKALDKAEANPTVDTSTAEGWTIIAGGSPVESGAGKALAFLTVISGSGKTVSILAVFNDPAYLKAAKDIHRYVGGFLMSPDGAFYVSQDADLVRGEHSGEYFSLGDAARRKLGVPAIDRHLYAREQGWMVQALVQLYSATLEEHYHREEDATMRRHVEIFGAELFDCLADQAVIEQDGAENGSFCFGTVW